MRSYAIQPRQGINCIHSAKRFDDSLVVRFIAKHSTEIRLNRLHKTVRHCLRRAEERATSKTLFKLYFGHEYSPSWPYTSPRALSSGEFTYIPSDSSSLNSSRNSLVSPAWSSVSNIFQSTQLSVANTTLTKGHMHDSQPLLPRGRYKLDKQLQPSSTAEHDITHHTRNPCTSPQIDAAQDITRRYTLGSQPSLTQQKGKFEQASSLRSQHYSLQCQSTQALQYLPSKDEIWRISKSPPQSPMQSRSTLQLPNAGEKSDPSNASHAQTSSQSTQCKPTQELPMVGKRRDPSQYLSMQQLPTTNQLDSLSSLTATQMDITHTAASQHQYLSMQSLTEDQQSGEVSLNTPDTDQTSKKPSGLKKLEKP